MPSCLGERKGGVKRTFSAMAQALAKAHANPTAKSQAKAHAKPRASAKATPQARQEAGPTISIDLTDQDQDQDQDQANQQDQDQVVQAESQASPAGPPAAQTHAQAPKLIPRIVPAKPTSKMQATQATAQPTPTAKAKPANPPTETPTNDVWPWVTQQEPSSGSQEGAQSESELGQNRHETWEIVCYQGEEVEPPPRRHVLMTIRYMAKFMQNQEVVIAKDLARLEKEIEEINRAIRRKNTSVSARDSQIARLENFTRNEDQSAAKQKRQALLRQLWGIRLGLQCAITEETAKLKAKTEEQEYQKENLQCQMKKRQWLELNGIMMESTRAGKPWDDLGVEWAKWTVSRKGRRGCYLGDCAKKALEMWLGPEGGAWQSTEEPDL